MSEAILSDDMKEVLQTFPGSYVSTVGDDLVPQITRVVGLKVADGDHVLVYIPQWYSEQFLEAIAKRPSIALVGVQVTTYRTFQFKGDVIDTYPSTDDDVSSIEAYVDGFGQLIAHVGLDSIRYNSVYASPPLTTLKLRVDQVFDQTPRVGAGNLVKERA